MAEVTTRGTGEVEKVADRAGLELSYRGAARTRNEAVAALSTPLARVKPAFGREGVEVRSRRLSVHDEWDGTRRAGCVAVQAYRLRVTDLAVLDDLLAEIIATEPATLDGPHWAVSDRAAAVADAQREAVADARRRATGYADALGAGLGDLVRLVDDADGGIVYGAAAQRGLPRGRADVRELGLEPELISIAATCTATWLLRG